jgi:outer membrane lipoprotein
MRYLPLMVLLLLSACATSGQRPVMGERDITPKMAVEDPDRLQAKVIEWGGAIVEARNLQDTTEFQILAYPLKKNGQPDLGESPTGRFIAVAKGYLETADYQTGRQLTLSGRLKGVRLGKVGAADYRFPVLQLDELLLWPLPSRSSTRTGVGFSFGAGSGGWSGGSIGIGIGF